MTELRRLYCERLPSEGGTVELPDESVHHARVLRLSQGAQVELFDAQGRAAQARLLDDAQGARARCMSSPSRYQPPPEPALHLVLGLPKPDKLDEIARMLTELGVASLELVVCERSVHRSPRLPRLARITRQACAQSGQAYSPELRGPRPLLEACAEIARTAPVGSARWLLWESWDTPRTQQAPTDAERTLPMWVIVGPEGGLAAHEVQALGALGFAHASLGGAVLRVDTAAVAVAALALDRLGRLR